jgi:hypothetical protein
MKTTVKTLVLLLLAGFLASSCSTVSRLNTEYEEENARIENMSPADRAAHDQERHENEKLYWSEFFQ